VEHNDAAVRNAQVEPVRYALFTVYLTMMSKAQHMQRQVVNILAKN
jgi:hypothetical protein